VINLRKHKKVKQIYVLGADPHGCDSCEHEPELITRIKASSWNEAIAKYLLKFPEFAAEPERFITALQVE
jgi:hypothetical protein